MQRRPSHLGCPGITKTTVLFLLLVRLVLHLLRQHGQSKAAAGQSCLGSLRLHAPGILTVPIAGMMLQADIAVPQEQGHEACAFLDLSRGT